MIAQTDAIAPIVRLCAPLVWRNDRRIAQKLLGFSLTELGSAHDMFRAAELATEPTHRRLFLRHALDEARHARRFRDAALALCPEASPRPHERRHALPQDLYRRLGPERFLAFVHLSEARAERQFRALAAHFSRRAARDPRAAELARLFEDLAREERFHVAYSRHLLQHLFSDADRARRAGRALSRERRSLAWAAWKRAGVRLGDRFTTLLMALVFVGVLPVFALALRLGRRGMPSPGWQRSAPAPTDHAALRRQA